MTRPTAAWYATLTALASTAQPITGSAGSLRPLPLAVAVHAQRDWRRIGNPVVFSLEQQALLALQQSPEQRSDVDHHRRRHVVITSTRPVALSTVNYLRATCRCPSWSPRPPRHHPPTCLRQWCTNIDTLPTATGGFWRTVVYTIDASSTSGAEPSPAAP